MVEDIRGVDTDLDAFRFADTEHFARTRVQTPVSEILEIPEAQVANLSGRAVFQQHFARRPSELRRATAVSVQTD
jgi:hypothetical protein